MKSLVDIVKDGVSAFKYSTNVINGSGRVYCYNDARWVTNADDNFGTTYYQFLESGGTASEPIREWEHRGDYVRAGTVLHELDIFGRITDVNTVTDMEISISYRSGLNRWDSIGLDNDSEDGHAQLWRGFWKAGGPGVTANTGPVNDYIRRSFPLGDYVAPADGDIRIYFKPVNVDPRPNTATDYMLISYSWLMSIPRRK